MLCGRIMIIYYNRCDQTYILGGMKFQNYWESLIDWETA